MNTITDALKKNLSGLYYGNRVIVPFNCHFLKVVIENDIITDFSPSSKGIIVREEEGFYRLIFS